MTVLYLIERTLDGDAIAPHVTWGTSPEMVAPGAWTGAHHGGNTR